MNTAQENFETLKDIRSMMERSSRFISLSGWSGIAAGLFAVAGAAIAWQRIGFYYQSFDPATNCPACLKNELMLIAAVVFAGAFISAWFFTFIKSKKEGVPIWGHAARRLLWNTMLPMLVGAVVIWRLMELKQYEFVVPSTLIFYGLALVNGSKYTMGEIRLLGYSELVLGLISLYLSSRSGLYLWALGFGVLHIIYGVAMWWKHDRTTTREME